MSVLTSLPELVKNYSGWFVVLAFAAFFVLERCKRSFPWPTTPRGSQLRRWMTGIVFGVLNHAFIFSCLSLPLLVWCCSVHLWTWPSAVPLWLLIVLTFLVRDLAEYWFHRLGHARLFFWRFHQIHHLDEVMDVTTELRVHFVERLMQTVVAAVLIVALSLPAIAVVLHWLVRFTMSLFHHANLRLPQWLERVLSLVVVTPAFHSPHHHEQKRDTNSNYGFIFPWWDMLFGTYNARRRTASWRMGLDYSPDLSCVGLLCEPFRPTPLWERQPVPASSEERQPASTSC